MTDTRPCPICGGDDHTANRCPDRYKEGRRPAEAVHPVGAAVLAAAVYLHNTGERLTVEAIQERMGHRAYASREMVHHWLLYWRRHGLVSWEDRRHGTLHLTLEARPVGG